MCWMPFFLQPESGAGLSPFGNLIFHFAVQCRYLQIGAQCRIHKIEWHTQEQVITLALEIFVRLDVDNNLQVAGPSTLVAGLPFTS